MRRRPLDDIVPIARVRRALATRQGRLYGFLNGQLNQGGSTSFSICALDLSTGKWEDTGEDVAGVREFTLNLGEFYDAGVKGWIHWYVNTWVFNTDVCDPDDTGLFAPASGQQGSGSSVLLGSASDPLLAELAAAVDASLAVSPDGGFYDDQLIPR